MAPGIRASDRERQAVAAWLQLAAAEGRLEVGEFEERVQRAFTARTRAELVELTQDLPARRDEDSGRWAWRRRRGAWPRRVGAYIVGNAALMAVWMAEVGARDPLVLGDSDFCWPVLSIVGWGGALSVLLWREHHDHSTATYQHRASLPH